MAILVGGRQLQRAGVTKTSNTGLNQASLRVVNPMFSPLKLKVGSTGGPKW